MMPFFRRGYDCWERVCIDPIHSWSNSLSYVHNPPHYAPFLVPLIYISKAVFYVVRTLLPLILERDNLNVLHKDVFV